MPKVIHFEIPADDPERAVKFYQKVFDWKIENWGGPVNYWLATTGPEDEPGVDGAIKEREDKEGIHNTIAVASIDDAIQKIEENGGEILIPKTEIPGIGYHAYFKDTEGNILGIMEGINAD